MLASENDALKEAKVGGVGDVVRDLPRALARRGWHVTTIIPSYGFLHTTNRSSKLSSVAFPFAGAMAEGEIWEAIPEEPHHGVRNLLFHHPAIGGEPIYYNDPPEQVFARDATKFALFCSGVGQYLKGESLPFVLHLHDWHMGFLLLLRELHPEFRHLKKIRTVFTIHNLALQGSRPIRGAKATVEQWYPELFTDDSWMEEWRDPRYNVPVFTPMAAGIRFADKVNTVSPTYASEILQPSDSRSGLIRGEGLEKYVQEALSQNRLSGILNGTEYEADRKVPVMNFPDLCDLLVREVGQWNGVNHHALHEEVIRRISGLRGNRPAIILTSVTRVTGQKVRLLFENGTRRGYAIDEILMMLKRVGGIYLFLGTGSNEYEEKLLSAFRNHTALLYLRGNSDAIAKALYANGDLFMMPSSFEPCGIGQMTAMRDSQPCVVNAVGGLKDTVLDGVNGFVFSGNDIASQAEAFITTTHSAIDLFLNNSARWQQIREEAGKARFTWEESAKKYIDLIYS